uniref:Thiol:disulfide interchange protein n=1 Tax=Candidatus Kentrum sp. FW TaxID=2126338 RepID=A0A450S546_9GAMM|nr:MAG: Thiol:disulfide interchange protein DsbC [Candidatus Kentron sp. FW]VFJ56178.1 MAG: Thiol:disulfide interchange protein DsbC [Candidatus Kentron sp. FW]
MLKKTLLPIIAIAMLYPSISVAAKDSSIDRIPASVRQAVQRILPMGVDSITNAPIRGLYEVTSGMAVIYISQDGKFAIQGDIFELKGGKNLTEKKQNHARRQAIEAIGEDGMIVFAPSQTRHTITVFTDVDCHYCRKLHNEVPALKDAGIAVRYLAFPRAGPSSDTYETMVSVWCAKDRQKAMTDAKTGKTVPTRKCAHPIAEHFALGREIGVRGTPAIVLEDGTLISGYLPASQLQDMLEKTSR